MVTGAGHELREVGCARSLDLAKKDLGFYLSERGTTEHFELGSRDPTWV